MTAYIPGGVNAVGREGWWSIPTIASKGALTAGTEAVAATVLQINLAMRPGFGASLNGGDPVEDPRLGASISYEAAGPGRITLGTITWVDRPQDASAAATAKHRDQLSEGTVTNLVNRRGLPSSAENLQAWASGQRYKLYPVIMGVQVDSAAPDGGGYFEYTQPVYVTGPVVYGTAAA